MRRLLSCFAALVLLPVTTVSAADDPMEIEVAAALERVKSPDVAKRSQAVNELVGLRRSASDALKAIVADANAGGLNDPAKMSAVILMGELGLADCAEVLAQERDWTANRMQWKGATLKTVSAFMSHGPRERDRNGCVAREASREMGMTPNLRVEPPTASGELSLCPSLSAALTRLHSNDPNACLEAEEAVRHWYHVVVRGLESVTDMWDAADTSRTPVYGKEVTLTAVYLLGEYRWCRALTRCIDIEDTADITASYARSLVAEVPDATYPAAVALAKCGGRARGAMLQGMWGNRTTQEGRERLARTLVAVDREWALGAFREIIESEEPASYRRKHLESVAAILQ